ncbi:Icc-related predicted phosphoesterase [Knoellia remsis]|uniref:Icc-related predicted phosphoesterase n=1 Tax=Knoellia remsis TaxID=407159 RepID=A0A2T0UXC1_9MICO|nr:metallophosphoesterase [Knoellia remsis]PRY62579.1 Icc-related predicted phosphoesterase [Knoellia remsis]
MVRVLAIADEVDHSLVGERLARMAPDLVVSAGDLPWDYVEAVASAANVPLVFVPGNHDPALARTRLSRSGMHLEAGMPCATPRPIGGINVDGRVADVAGLRIAGLGGCVRYRPGPNMYSQAEYRRRALLLRWRLWLHRRRDPRGVDILLTHAPPRGVGDEDDRPHVGIEALHGLVERLRPTWLLHGHIHPHGIRREDRQMGGTTVRNVVPVRLFDVESRGGSGWATSERESWTHAL